MNFDDTIAAISTAHGTGGIGIIRLSGEKVDYGVYRYTTDIMLNDGGEYGYTFRVVPYHPNLINRFELGLIRWVVQ